MGDPSPIKIQEVGARSDSWRGRPVIRGRNAPERVYRHDCELEFKRFVPEEQTSTPFKARRSRTSFSQSRFTARAVQRRDQSYVAGIYTVLQSTHAVLRSTFDHLVRFTCIPTHPYLTSYVSTLCSVLKK